jgi:hypothetical protein
MSRVNTYTFDAETGRYRFHMPWAKGEWPADGPMEYYWVANNGASSALCGFPASPPHIRCSPTPNQLIGYTTWERAREAQPFFLNAPIAEVRKYELPLDCASVRPHNPEPPTHGPTMWMVDKGEPRAVETQKSRRNPRGRRCVGLVGRNIQRQGRHGFRKIRS